MELFRGVGRSSMYEAESPAPVAQNASPRAAARALGLAEGRLVPFLQEMPLGRPRAHRRSADDRLGDRLMESVQLSQFIHLIRGRQVVLDRDIAKLYGVAAGAMNRAVLRNQQRFPDDFMFRLSGPEWRNLKCQIGISSWGGDRSAPYAFTEQGVAMLSSVLRAPRAIAVNIAIMRAFVRLRRALSLNSRLAERLRELENKVDGHDETIASLIEAIQTAETKTDHPRIGFAP